MHLPFAIASCARPFPTIPPLQRSHHDSILPPRLAARCSCLLPPQNRYEIRFGEPRLTHPAHTEADDDSMTPLYPAEARLRNLTYETLLLVDVHKTAFNAVTNEPEGAPTTSQEQFGSIPLMVQSAYCRLKNMTDKDKTRFGECVFDQVRSKPLQRVCDSVQCAGRLCVRQCAARCCWP